MITEVHDQPEVSMGSLVSGIVDDFRDLVRQELLLARQRIAEDLRKTREATLVWALSVGAMLVSGITFSMMLAHLLHTATSPAGDPASVPLWACYGIVGVVSAIGGAAAFVAGRKKFESIRLVDSQARKEVSNG
jgi:hypothetical protein